MKWALKIKMHMRLPREEQGKALLAFRKTLTMSQDVGLYKDLKHGGLSNVTTRQILRCYVQELVTENLSIPRGLRSYTVRLEQYWVRRWGFLR
jgi:hypothetical protein